jgi:hypothetical protein
MSEQAEERQLAHRSDVDAAGDERTHRMGGLRSSLGVSG